MTVPVHEYNAKMQTKINNWINCLRVADDFMVVYFSDMKTNLIITGIQISL